jgi:hypothetical protein
MNASALIRKPPPIQITANTTWNVLKAPYQSSGEAIMKSTATSTKITPMTYVGVRFARAWESGERVSSLGVEVMAAS